MELKISLDHFKVTRKNYGDRQKLLGDIGELIGDINYPKLAKRFEGIDTNILRDFYFNSLKWKTNPAALFNKRVKEYKKSLK